MLRVGLTGGVGCGKSAVADLFAELGVPVIDADQLAREVVAGGEATLDEIRQRFGDAVLQPDGHLDRRQLRRVVFHDDQARLDLEAILHPRIRQRMQQRLAALDHAPYVLLSIPLLLETGQLQSVERVLVVDCTPDQQIKRVCARDKVGPEQAQGILHAQCSRQERLSVADDIIDNTGPLNDLRSQVRNLHDKYLALSACR